MALLLSPISADVRDELNRRIQQHRYVDKEADGVTNKVLGKFFTSF